MPAGGDFKLDGQLEVAAARRALNAARLCSTASTMRAAAMSRAGAAACGMAARRRGIAHGLGDGSRASTRTSGTLVTPWFHVYDITMFFTYINSYLNSCESEANTDLKSILNSLF